MPTKKAPLKTHISRECKNIYWRTPEDQILVVKVFDKLTCGACKRRILEQLAELDWTDPRHLDVLCRLDEMLFESTKKNGKPKEGATPSQTRKVTKKPVRSTRSCSRGKLVLVCKSVSWRPSLARVRVDTRSCKRSRGLARDSWLGRKRLGARYCGGCGSAEHLAKIRV